MSFGYQVLGFGSGGGPSTYNVQYLVIAGGGGGGGLYRAGGGGAGGMRFSPGKSSEVIPGTSYTISVGAGGTPYGGNGDTGTNGLIAVFSDITSAGGENCGI